MSSAILINRDYVTNFETDLSYKVVDSWSRTLKNLWVTRIMLVEGPHAAAKWIQEWNLETARIHNLGPKGKDMVFDPMITASQEVLYDHFGNALALDRSQISDDRISRAPKWMSETGHASAYWPQRLAAMMLKNGK